MIKRFLFSICILLLFSSLGHAQRVYSMRKAAQAQQTAETETSVFVLSLKPGYHIYPSSGYYDSITNDTSHPVALNNMNGFTIGEELDWFVLPELSVSEELDRYSGEIRYIGGGIFKQTVVPLLLTVKYWAFNNRIVKPYIGTGIGAYFIDRRYTQNTVTEQSSTQLGYHMVVGISFVVNKSIRVGIEDRYAWAQALENSILNPLILANTDDGGNSTDVFISINL
ncbi:MAG: P44/Msp2 family outer membrane protein [bacterium]